MSDNNTINPQDLQANANPKTVALMRRFQGVVSELSAIKDSDGKMPWPIAQAVARAEESCFWLEKQAIQEAVDRTRALAN